MNPIFFRDGGFALHYSQVIFLGAFLISYLLSRKRARKFGFADPEWERALTYYAVGGFVGGRVGYVLANSAMFQGRWSEVLTLWHGAFTLWGALIGFLAAAQILKRVSRHCAGLGLDVLAPIFPLFLGIAEWGLFTEGEGWGRIGQGFLALEQGGVARYPLWLGYSLWFLLTAVGLTFKSRRRDGESFAYMSASLGLATLVFTPFALLPGSAVVQYAWGSVALCTGLGFVIFRARRSKA